ncbi:MAG: hypothetical protein M3144_04055 [Actinomycetota bacterium]|nr:hypothetical protein [Actinomycetota bacterium]
MARVYRVDYTATDPQGGACAGIVRVGVPRSQGNDGQAVESPLVVDSFGE